MKDAMSEQVLLKSVGMYSPPLSVYSIFSLHESKFSIKHLNLAKQSNISDLCLRGNNQE
jgi:hypothetical protein